MILFNDRPLVHLPHRPRLQEAHCHSPKECNLRLIENRCLHNLSEIGLVVDRLA